MKITAEWVLVGIALFGLLIFESTLLGLKFLRAPLALFFLPLRSEGMKITAEWVLDGVALVGLLILYAFLLDQCYGGHMRCYFFTIKE